LSVHTYNHNITQFNKLIEGKYCGDAYQSRVIRLSTNNVHTPLKG